MWPWRAESIAESTRLRELEILVSLYKLGVETQMHFNELILRTRTFGASGLVLVLGGAVVLRSQFPTAGFTIGPLAIGDATVGPYILPMAAGVALLGLVLVGIVYQLDRGYYMRLLRGATIYVYRIEDHAEKEGLTISGYSEGFRQARQIRDAIGRPDASVKFVNRAYVATAIVSALIFVLLLFGQPS